MLAARSVRRRISLGRHGVGWSDNQPPNESRLSCGRRAPGRKELAPRGGPPGEATTHSFKNRPDSFKRMLGGAAPARVTVNHSWE